MFAIGILICVVFVMLIQTFVSEIYNRPSSSSFKNDSNVSMSSLYLDSWLHDAPESADWKVLSGQHTETQEKGTVDPNITSEFSVTNKHVSPFAALNILKYEDSNFTMKESSLRSLLSPPTSVKPDWSVILGTFEHYADNNWENFLIQIEIPYMQRLFLITTSETATISRIFKDGKKDINGIVKKPFNIELGKTSADFELIVSTTFWPFTHDSQIRLGEPSMEHDLDGTDSLNTFFFAAPHLLVQDKIKPQWRTIVVRHFYQQGLNMTIIDKERMVIARRYFKRIK